MVGFLEHLPPPEGLGFWDGVGAVESISRYTGGAGIIIAIAFCIFFFLLLGTNSSI